MTTTKPKKIKVRWPLEVCKTCHRRAIWPFCEHYNGVDGSWFKTIWVTGMIEPRLDGKEHDAR